MKNKFGELNSIGCRLFDLRGVAPTEMRTLLTNTVIIRRRIEGERFFSTIDYRWLCFSTDQYLPSVK
jgi:hypothetical protein